MDHLCAGVLVLARARKSNRQCLTLGPLPDEEHRRVLHGHFRAEVSVNPFHRRALVGNRALGHQVVDVGRPVLNGRVANTSVFLHDDFHDRRVQRITGVNGGGAAFDVVHVAALIGNN